MDKEKLLALWNSRRWYVIGGGVGLVLAVSIAVQVFAAGPPPPLADPIATHSPEPAADSGEIIVDVEGAVVSPGLKRLPVNALVDDALAAAGGFSPQADGARVAKELNRADKLKPNQKIYVPVIGEAVTASTKPTSASTTTSGSGDSESPGGIVNLNTATLAELDGLPGVGPSTAQKIIDYREQNGGFGSVDELNEVSGIGDAKFADLKDLVTI
ncbi:ComEA family DNA-binding protein [Patescibacteria group bacterium]|nr:ComEA family DNA-binding protein [Patescibacteria group bacterium]